MNEISSFMELVFQTNRNDCLFVKDDRCEGLRAEIAATLTTALVASESNHCCEHTGHAGRFFNIEDEAVAIPCWMIMRGQSVVVSSSPMRSQLRGALSSACTSSA
jgi:hypothetical protein